MKIVIPNAVAFVLKEFFLASVSMALLFPAESCEQRKNLLRQLRKRTSIGSNVFTGGLRSANLFAPYITGMLLKPTDTFTCNMSIEDREMNTWSQFWKDRPLIVNPHILQTYLL